jgi:hypothetical protein
MQHSLHSRVCVCVTQHLEHTQVGLPQSHAHLQHSIGVLGSRLCQEVQRRVDVGVGLIRGGTQGLYSG